MTLRAPLAVRISDGATDQHVTRATSGLKFRKTAPGGFASIDATVDLDPYGFTDLGPADKIYVYGPDGRTLCEGFLDYPGNIDSRAGRALDLSAMGTASLVEDRSQNLVYIDRDLTKWEQVRASTLAVSASAGSSDDPSASAGGATTEGLLCAFASGQAINTNYAAQIGYSALVDAGMELGALSFTIKDGKTDANFRTELATSHGAGTASVVTFGTGISTSVRGPFVRFVALGGSSFPTGENRMALQLRRSGGATTVSDETTWSFFYDVTVLGRRMGSDGTLVSGTDMTAADYVRADWVVTDLVGRLLAGLVDPAALAVGATTWHIDQLAYHDGVRMGQVLDDLALWEPDMLWELLHDTGDGYQFNYRPWPTTARYEVSTRDGFEQTGADVDLCNRIVVTWTDAKGKPRSTIVAAGTSLGVDVAGTAATVVGPALSALEQQGRVRDAEPIDLPEGFGSAANAQRIGEAALALAATLPTAAKVTIRKPIPDLLRGGMAAQYEIEPGYLVRVRETGDLLRLTEMEYDDDSGTATLTLGTPALTVEQRVAKLSKVRQYRAA